jgi:hypothetical protein
MIHLLTEADLSAREPKFLWRSPYPYHKSQEGECIRFIFGRSRKATIVKAVVLTSLVVVGALEISAGGPLYGAIIPPVVFVFATCYAGWRRRQHFENAQLDASPRRCIVSNGVDKMFLPSVIEIRVENRWRNRKGTGVVDGNAELFIVTEAEGEKRFFPLGDSGVLRDLDQLGNDLAAACKVPLVKELVK